MKRVKKKKKKTNSLTISASIILPTGDGSSAHVNNFRFPPVSKPTYDVVTRENKSWTRERMKGRTEKEIVPKRLKYYMPTMATQSFVQVQRN